MEDNEEWVLVRAPSQKDLWNPTSPNAADESSRPLKVTFSGPAKYWTDAIPIGNGRLGAMVWGGVQNEVLQLNEDTLWTGVPANYTDKNAPQVLAEVRKLVDDKKYPEATTAADKLSGAPSEVYQLLGDIKLEFDDSHMKYSEESYRRELDLDNATAKIKYNVGDVEFTREHFVSNPDQVLVTKISTSKPGSLSFTVSLDSKLHHNSRVSGQNQIIMEGSCPGKRIPPQVNSSDEPKGIQFCAVLDMQISNDKGVIHVLDDKKFKVEGSDWVILFLTASSSFDGPFTNPKDSKKDPTSESLSKMKSVKSFSYNDIYARHLDDYQKLFHRVSLQLSKSSKTVLGQHTLGGEDTVPTSSRVKSFQNDEDPSFVELLFQYGRYLLIACSRPGTQVANLQGIWNKDVAPAWDGAQHLNINLQMNYWPSLSCNLHECQEPLFDYISALSVNGSKTAKVNYEANGWVTHQVSDVWAKTSPDRGMAVWALWPMGGAWLCCHLWEHYTYTLDKEFLKNKAYPLLEGCTLFLLDWLIQGPGGLLETNPSTSPEHMFIAPDQKQASVSYSSTMDISIIKEVFSIIISAAEVLGRHDDTTIKRVIESQSKLPPTKVARDGSIMEWAEDFQDPDEHHRHVSHLFGLFPGHTINLEKTPDLCKAVDYSLIKRGDEGPGWSTTWKAALWAHGYYTTRLWIGTPPQMFALIVDTGSTVTYVPCSTCEQCGRHQDPKFQPDLSSTYQPVKCSMDCNCDNDRMQCVYERQYAEMSTSSGVLGEDLISFGNQSELAPQRAIFGCENVETGDLYSQHADGIMGLGRGDLSIMDQLVDKNVVSDSFSLCYGGMNVGGGAMVLGGISPPSDMVFAQSDPVRSPYYNIDLKEIHVAGKRLPLKPSVFDGKHGTVLDSGTTYAYLPEEAFLAFKEAIVKELQSFNQISGPDPNYNDLCFSGAGIDVSQLSKNFPVVDMVFGNGQKYSLSPENYMFRHSKVRGAYCLGIFQNGKDPTTLLGGIIVRNTLVMYDREQTKVGFWKTNCAELWERLQISMAPPPINSTKSVGPTGPPSVSQHNLPPGGFQIALITIAISFNISYEDMKPHLAELAGLIAHELDVNTSQIHLLNFTSFGNDSLSRWVITPRPYADYFSNATTMSIIGRLAEHHMQLPDTFGSYKLIDWNVEPPPKRSWWKQYYMVVGLVVLLTLLLGLSIFGIFLIWKKRQQQSVHSYKPVDVGVPEQELQPL